MKKIIFGFVLVFALGLVNFAQTTSIEKTPAYKCLAVEKVKLNLELDNLRRYYRDLHPDVQAKKVELESLNVEMAKLIWFDSQKTALLTENYGKLIVEKIAAERDLRVALNTFLIKHPIVQQKIQKLTLAEAKIAEYIR